MPEGKKKNQNLKRIWLRCRWLADLAFSRKLKQARVLRLSRRYSHCFSARARAGTYVSGIRNSTSLSTAASSQFVHLGFTECITYPRRKRPRQSSALRAARKIWASSRRMIPCFRCFIFMAAPFSRSIALTRKQIYRTAVPASHSKCAFPRAACGSLSLDARNSSVTCGPEK